MLFNITPCVPIYLFMDEKHLHNKGNISKVKRQPSEWEKIIANEDTDKELISKIYK